MWEAILTHDAPGASPAGTVECVGTRDERRHVRHTKKRSGGVRTSKLGAVQRRVLMRLLNLAWDRAAKDGTDPADAWVKWEPKKQGLLPNFTSKEASSLSKALVSLENRRLLMVSRHDGGRAQAIRLTVPGFDIAMELQRNNGRTVEQRREEMAQLLPAWIPAAAPIAYREIKRTGISDEYRDALKSFVELYDLWTGDPEDRGTGNYMPGIGATPKVFVALLKAFNRLAEASDAFAQLRS